MIQRLCSTDAWACRQSESWKLGARFRIKSCEREKVRVRLCDAAGHLKGC